MSHIIIPGTANNSSYKNYVALLTQTGMNAPVATVLVNTLGNIVWTRNVVGEYFGTLVGAFPQDKTYLTMQFKSGGVDLEIFWDSEDRVIIGTQGSDGELTFNSIEIRVYG